MRFKVLGNRRRAPWQGTVALSADAAGGAEGSVADVARPWLLLNLSGEVASRLEADPAFADLVAGLDAQQPVLLTDAQIDQVAGLISLRGGAPIDLYATPSVFENLTTTLPVLPELERLCGVHWHMVAVAGDRRVAGFQVRGQESLAFTAYDTGPAPEGCLGDPGSPAPGHSIAVEVRERASGRRAVFARGMGAMALGLMGALDGVHCLLVDPGSREAARSEGALASWMATLAVPRRVMLGGAAAELRPLGIEAPRDGQDIVV
jgi:pyrroloquinoline quinone biosynthesis protein B